MTPAEIEKLLAAATPGRWLVTSSALLRIAVSHGKGGIVLAGVHRFGKNGGATCLGSPDANARLIAAAPDLARLALDQARELAANDARIAECTAELLYLRYCHDAGYSGAKWAANDEKDLWRDKARARDPNCPTLGQDCPTRPATQ